MTRLRARARENRRIREAPPGGHWKVQTILGEMGLRGVVAAMSVGAATDAEVFFAYLDQVLSRRNFGRAT